MSEQLSVKPLSATELAAWRGMLVAHARIVRALDHELVEAHNLPLSAYEVLLILSHVPDGRMRMAELGERLLLTPSGISRLVDRLVDGGLVVRERCTDDRRGFFACVTGAGRDRFAEARGTHMRGIRQRYLAHVDEAEQVALGAIWRRMVDVDEGPAPVD